MTQTGEAAAAAAKKPAIPSPKPLGPLFRRLRAYPGLVALGTLTLVLSVGMGLAFPWLVGELLDAVYRVHDGPKLNYYAALLVLLFLVQGLFNFIQVWSLTRVAEQIIAKLRGDLFAHLVHLSPGFFAERRSGELSSRLSADVTMLQGVLSYQVTELLRQLLYLAGGIALLAWLQTQLTITTLAVVPVIIGAAFVFGRLLRRSSTLVQDKVAEAMGMANETFGHIRIVQSFTREAFEAKRYTVLLREVVVAALRRAWVRGVFFGSITFIGFTGVAVVLWQAGQLALAGRLSEGALVQFILLAFTVAAAFGALAQLFGQFQEAVGAAQRVFELLETKAEIADPPAPVVLPRPVRGDVRFDRVSFRYGPDLPDVLHDVSFRIIPGEVVALVGQTGHGKTTLASLVPRFWDPTRGTVTLDRIDVRRLALHELRSVIGLVPQEPALVSGTVRENIAFARPDASDRDILRAAKAAHAMEFIDRLPAGLSTLVGERGVKLSAGQRQRIAIARVFLKDPAVVILDEATSSLDSASEKAVEEAMVELLRGRSTLIISHHFSTVRRADRIVVIEHGKVIEEGSHTQLLGDDSLYARLYRLQVPDSPRPRR